MYHAATKVSTLHEGRSMPQTTGILSSTNHVNIRLVTVLRGSHPVGTFPFSTQFTEEEARIEAVKLQTGLDGSRYAEYRTIVIEAEVLDKNDLEDVTTKGTHAGFVQEIQGATAAIHTAVRRRFTEDHGAHWGVMNTTITQATSDLIDLSRGTT